MGDGYMDMAHAQLPSTLQGRAGEAQLRLARRRGQDLDMAGADPQAEAAAKRLDGRLFGGPPSCHEGRTQLRAGLLLGRREDPGGKTGAVALRPISVRSIPSPTSISAPGVEAQEKKDYTTHSIDLF